MESSKGISRIHEQADDVGLRSHLAIMDEALYSDLGEIEDQAKEYERLAAEGRVIIEHLLAAKSHISEVMELMPGED